MERLQQAGAHPIGFPVIDIRPPLHTENLMDRLARVAQYDMLIFISANAVRYGLQTIAEAGGMIGQSVSAIGKSTAAALREQGIQVTLEPESGFNTEALLADTAFDADAIRGKKVLIVRGQGGRELLADSLRSRGAEVDYAEVYRRCRPAVDDTEVHRLWQNGQIQIVTVTSNEALKNLYDMLTIDTRSYLLNTPLVVPGPRAAELALQSGFRAEILTAANATDQAMLDAIRQWHKGH